MTALNAGPCQPWEPMECVVFPSGSEAVSGFALEAATELLWLKTQRRFGLCEVTFRPCRRGCGVNVWGFPWISPTAWGWPYPALVGGRWYNLGCGCEDSCSCTRLHQIELPYPLAEVVEVLVDGEVVPETSYRVDDWRWLVRTDGEDWPSCNDLNLEDTEEGTWSVTATYGEAVPILGRFAVGELALDLAKGLCGASGCKLPSSTVKEITRQGVSKKFLLGDVLNGQTGLTLTDRFVNTFNPTRSQPAAIYSIDRKPPRRVGT